MNFFRKGIIQFNTDWNGFLWRMFRKYKLLLILKYSNIYNQFSCFIRGIKLGRSVSFYGCSKFFRAYNSSITIGNNCNIRSSSYSNLVGLSHPVQIATLKENANVSIGNFCGISGAYISCACEIIIGDNVMIGANVTITDYDWHNIAPHRRYDECDSFAPIKINKNVFIGMNTLILKGITIGENSVIGANSVVVKDIPENVIAAGNPCKVLRNL